MFLWAGTRLIQYLLRVGMISLVSGGVLAAQTIVTTYVGSSHSFSGNGQPASAVSLQFPSGVAVDGQGNAYIADSGLEQVLKVSSSGTITVVAGDGLARFSGDGGSALGASLNNPTGLAIDQAGNLYIADQYNSRVRKVNPAGIITTFAGTGQSSFAGDGGLATKAELSGPSALAIDSSGNLYIADSFNNRIRRVSTAGLITTVAGNGSTEYDSNGNPRYNGDGGSAINAALTSPRGVAVDSSGNVYIADTYASRVRQVSPSGFITTLAGNGNYGSSGDAGPSTSALLSFPIDVAVDGAGNLYISDSLNQRIRRVSPNGVITTTAGNGTAGFTGDGGLALSATFADPQGLAVDSSGAVLVADLINNRVRRFVVGGNVATYAGNGFSIGDNGPSQDAVLAAPNDAAVDVAGNVYVADLQNNRIRKVAASGLITTFAGNGQAGYSGDGGPAASASLNAPGAVALDSAGNAYIADSGNNVIRKVDTTGRISTVAGNGKCCYSGDGGSALNALLFAPQSVTVDAAGNIYFDNKVRTASGQDVGVRIRQVTAAGVINTFAGSGAVGFSGDGQTAVNASFGNFLSVTAAPDGSLYIADRDNNRVRRIDTTGTINTVAGDGSSVVSGNGGQALAAGIPAPLGLTFDTASNLYVSSVNTIRVISASGVVNTYAGTGEFGFAGDGGPPAQATFAFPTGLAADAGSYLYIADRGNNRVRVVQQSTGAVATLSTASLNFQASGAPQTFTVANSGKGTMNWNVTASTVSGGAWLSVSPLSGLSIAGQAASPVTVTISSTDLAPGDYYGQILVTAPSAPNSPRIVTVLMTVGSSGPAAPVIGVGGVASAASYQVPLAPGSLVAIFGTGLAATTVIQSEFPLPSTLAGTSVSLGGLPLPLLFVSDGQINAVLPFGLPVDTTQDMVVQRGDTLSAPESVPLAAGAPGVFTTDESGSGMATVDAYHTDGTISVITPAAPAHAGDILIIYCTGLGDTQPKDVAGFPASNQLSYVINPVTVMVGGQPATVSFAGLTPGFTGLYQVNALLPDNIAASSSVPLVVSQGNVSGATVTISVQ